MKDSKLLQKRYALSLYAACSDDAERDAVGADLSKISEALVALGNVAKIALNSKVPAKVKGEIWSGLLSELKVAPKVESFIKVLVKSNRINLLQKIVERFQMFSLQSKGIRIAKVTTALELSDAEVVQIVKDLKEILEGNDVILTHKVDKSLIGGMVLMYDSFMLDASVRNRIVQLKSNLLS